MNARHDPTYVECVINDLLDHKGEWRHPHHLFGGDVWTARDAVQVGRNIGLLIEGDRQRGYCFRGWKRIPYRHRAKALAWPPEGSEMLCFEEMLA